MKTTQLMMGAALLLGACDELWAPFQGPNPNFCDPSQPACVLAGDASAAVDAGVDFTVPADAAVVDLTTTQDLSGCTPAPASPWVMQPSPTGAGGVTLTGVTGNGTGVWVVGGSSYAAYVVGAASNQITGMSGSGISRVAYMAAASKAIAPVNCGIDNVCVAVMGTSSASVVSMGLLLTGTVAGGVWADQSAPGTAFMLSTSGTLFTSTTGQSWSSAGSGAPGSLSVLSGPPLGGESILWGIAGSGKKVAQYTTSWKTVPTGTLVFNSIWYGPGNLVWLVGAGGVLRVIPANVAPSGAFTTVATNVTKNLNDVVGTKDGEDVFIVGAAGTLLHYEAKCQTLTSETNPVPTADLYGVWVDETAKKAWAVGANGTVLTRAIP